MGGWVGTSELLTSEEEREIGVIGVGTQDRILGFYIADTAVTLQIEESSDGGVTYDRQITPLVSTADAVEVIDVNPIYGNTVRFTVTNEAADSTYFRFGAKTVSAGPR